MKGRLFSSLKRLIIYLYNWLKVIDQQTIKNLTNRLKRGFTKRLKAML
jgi:hypothetical protein